MNLLYAVTSISICLISIIKSQNLQCRGIYDSNLEIYALDVCVNNTLLGFPISQRYFCENNVMKSHWWYFNKGNNCQGPPNDDNRVDIHANKTVCEGSYNCSYSIIRVYEYNNYCNDYAVWSDRAIMTDICQPNTNTTQGTEGMILRCDKDKGIIKQQYSTMNGDECTGDLVKEDVIFPATGNDTCKDSLNLAGVYAKFQTCNKRANATTPTAYPTQSPTPRTSAGGSYSPTMSPTQPTQSPTYEQTDETWFITALVFICMFGVLLCCMCGLGYNVWQQPSRRKKRHYDKAPTDEEAGVETTDYK